MPSTMGGFPKTVHFSIVVVACGSGSLPLFVFVLVAALFYEHGRFGLWTVPGGC